MGKGGGDGKLSSHQDFIDAVFFFSVEKQPNLGLNPTLPPHPNPHPEPLPPARGLGDIRNKTNEELPPPAWDSKSRISGRQGSSNEEKKKVYLMA